MQLPMRVLKKLMMMGGWFDAERARRFTSSRGWCRLTRSNICSETRRWAEQLTLIPTEHVQVAKMSIHRMYELMGLVNMAAVQNKLVGHLPNRRIKSGGKRQ